MKDKLDALLKRVEAARSTVDAARAELVEVEKDIRRLISGPDRHASGALAKSRGKLPPATKTLADTLGVLGTRIKGVPCPQCGGPMTWRFSRVKSARFAGCEKFPNCRGARSRAEVERGLLELESTKPGATADPAASEMVQHFDDVAVKHHGPDAPIALQEAALGYSPLPDLSELRDGPEPKVDDDLGVPF